MNIMQFKSRFSSSESRALLGGGAVITFLATGKQSNNQIAIFEAKGIPGMEPPPHMHTNEDEWYYLLEGEFAIKVGGDEFKAVTGDYVFFPRKIRHEFKVLSPTFRCLIGIHPAGLEDYFMALSVEHAGEEIPPVNKNPPSPEFIEKLKQLNRKFGITYYYQEH